MTFKIHECPHCGNRSGFAAGTCIECGWNDIEHQFHWVRVDIDDVPHGSHGARVINVHADRTRNMIRRWRDRDGR